MEKFEKKLWPHAILVTPSLKYKQSFLQALQEFHQEDRFEEWDSEKLQDDHEFSKFINGINLKAKGENLKEWEVPVSTLWLIDDGEFIGRVLIRHHTNENITSHIGFEIKPSKRKMGYGAKALELAIPIARNLGITEAILNCDENNVASRKIIESFGGELKTTKEMRAGRPKKLSYALKL